MAVRDLTKCRICGNSELTEVLDLGIQSLTGVFPLAGDQGNITRGPLSLVWCSAHDGCGLIQLAHTYDPNEMYGENYGYRSGLNPSMVRHLKHRVDDVMSRINLGAGDIAIDIGSNDGTTLGFLPSRATRIGIDPAANKFADFYPEGTTFISDFFSRDAALAATGGKRASVITAFSMMYDLDDPKSFVKEVAEVLSPEGLFVFEQSYLPLMLERVAFDTVCHEHLEYYGLRQIEHLLHSCGLEVVDVEVNDVNGGSFAVTSGHRGRHPITNRVEELRQSEAELWSNTASILEEFRRRTNRAIEDLRDFIKNERAAGKHFACLGASTKGNVLLQAANLGPTEIEMIGDVNPDKDGRLTPGTAIPIVSETTALSREFDYYIVLPWHFRDFFVSSPSFHGKTLVFPLPHLEVVRPA